MRLQNQILVIYFTIYDVEGKLLPVDSNDEFHPTKDGEPVKAKYRFEFPDDEDDKLSIGMRNLKSELFDQRYIL